MAQGVYILKNYKGQVVRTFRWNHDRIAVVRRQDTGRVETYESVQAAKDLDLPVEVLAETTPKQIQAKALKIGGMGTIEYSVSLGSFTPSYEIPPIVGNNFEDVLRWTAVGHMAVVALILVLSYFFSPDSPLNEERLVTVVSQARKPVPKKIATVPAVQKKIKQIQRKLKPRVVKPKKMKIKKVVKNVTKPQRKSQIKPQPRPKRQIVQRATKAPTQRIVKRTHKPKAPRIDQMGALGVLGGANKNSKRAGGIDARAFSNRRAGGSGGSVATRGSSKTWAGQGLLSASAGSGNKAQRVGGYGTRGRAGGRNGYGNISMVGSSAAFAVPVDSGEIDFSGGLDREQIAAVIRRHIGQVRFCYEKGLQVKPGLSGRVQVRFVINPVGRVNIAKVASTSLRARSVESCIISKLKSWQFPRPVGGVNVKVSYPFTLKRVSQG